VYVVNNLICSSHIRAPFSCSHTLSSCSCCLPCDLPLHSSPCNVYDTSAVPLPAYASKSLLTSQFCVGVSHSG